MNNSFYNGVSGIKTHQFGLDIWASNIANANKVGFKISTPEFSTIYAQTMTASPTTPIANDVGTGSHLSASSINFQQGAITKTENPFDLAINGEGWFGIVTPGGEELFTRAGLFNRDATGYLTDAAGNFLIGTPANNIQDGVVIDNPTRELDLSVPEAQSKILLQDDIIMPAVPTNEVTFKGSLNSKPIYKIAQDNTKIEIPNKENFQSVLINSDGTTSKLIIDFTKVVPQAIDKTIWKAKATIVDQDNNTISSKEGELLFNDRGAMISNSLQNIDNNGTEIKLNLGSLYDPNKPNSGFDGLFSYHSGEEYFAKSVTQNGKKGGELTDYTVQDDGLIVAGFDNGDTIPIAKIALYHFRNNTGLEQSSPIYYKQTANSGVPTFYKDKDGKTLNTTIISSHALETANISMGTALTELIVMQKAYDASAKSITTSDQMIQNAINMKK